LRKTFSVRFRYLLNFSDVLLLLLLLSDVGQLVAADWKVRKSRFVSRHNRDFLFSIASRRALQPALCLFSRYGVKAAGI